MLSCSLGAAYERVTPYSLSFEETVGLHIVGVGLEVGHRVVAPLQLSKLSSDPCLALPFSA
jgi:hypothetical protein